MSLVKSIVAFEPFVGSPIKLQRFHKTFSDLKENWAGLHCLLQHDPGAGIVNNQLKLKQRVGLRK